MTDARKTLAMFPGQGSQYVGMGKILLEEFTYTKDLFEEAADTAKIDIRRLCLEGPESDLKLTANTQPCIVTVSIATWKVLQNEIGFQASYFAGHSLGEYSALVAASRLDFAVAISLVRARGQAMQKAVPEGLGAMSAVLSIEAKKLESLCSEISTENATVEVVNYNSPQQLVVAGHASKVDDLEKKLSALGVKFVRLAVSAPFHSRLMKPARVEMSPLLESTRFSQNTAIVSSNFMIPNLTGSVCQDYGSDYLIQQIDSPVKWIQSIESSHQVGVNDYVEIGPGRVLMGLLKRILPKGDWLSSATDDIKGFLASRG